MAAAPTAAASAFNPFSTTAGSIGFGLDILGGLGSFFGSNGAAKQAQQYQANANQQADTLGDVENAYRGNAEQQQGFYNIDNPNARAAAGNLLRYYQTDPLSDSRYAFDLNRAKAGLDANIATAQNRAIAQDAASGRTQAGGAPSSTSAGVAAYLAARDALGTQDAQNRVAAQNVQIRQRNLQAANDLEQGIAGQDYARENQSYGQEANVGSTLMNYWSNQAAQERGLAQGMAQGGMSALGQAGGSLAFGPAYGQGYHTMSGYLSSNPWGL